MNAIEPGKSGLQPINSEGFLPPVDWSAPPAAQGASHIELADPGADQLVDVTYGESTGSVGRKRLLWDALIYNGRGVGVVVVNR
jgi:hypothetical protein